MAGPVPLVAPPPWFVEAAESWASRLTGAIGAIRCAQRRHYDDGTHNAGLVVVELLTERTRLRGLVPQGRTSHGGATRLLPCADGWVALSLARPTDVDLVPAWRGLHGLDTGSDDPWADVTDLVRDLPGADLVHDAELLGLPLGVLGERLPDGTDGVARTTFGPTTRRADPIRVLDLSALWAGPLCAALLGRAGAEVTKVESVERPDDARVGDALLYDRLNRDKQHRTLDLGSRRGRVMLAALVARADVVVTASRHRALVQLGLDPTSWLARSDGPQVWVSITGHGLASDRVAFGDDAAVAGGLVEHTPDGPTFAGDALADPLSGLAAATHAAEALARGERVLLDVAMAGVAAAAATAAGR